MSEFKTCPTCNEKHNKTNSAYCCKNIDKECPVCKETFKTKCNKGEKIFCDRYCQIGAESAKRTGKEPVRAKAKEKTETKIKHCINCNVEVKGKGDYCYKKVKSECAYCGNEITQTCAKVMKRYCGRKCSASHKKNECLRCGRPAKEKYCGEKVTINCKTCGKEKIVSCKKDIPEYCTTKCALQDPEVKERIRDTQVERYGAFAFNTEKQKKTMIERYGYETPAKNEEVKKRAKKKQFENNGGIWAFNTSRQNETMMNKYGSLGRLGDPEEMNKQIAIMLERYGVRTPSEHPEFQEKAMKTLMDKYGKIFNNDVVSKLNKNFAERLRSELAVNVEFELYIQKPGVFFDLYLPGTNLAIELNPTITHNSTTSFVCLKQGCKDVPCDKHSPTAKDYHLKRAKIAKDNGLNLIQIFEWEDDNKLIDFIENKLSTNKTKYSARKLSTKKITQTVANKFLKDTHLQGGAKGQIYCYGMYENEDLLAVATFSKGRFNSKAEWEFMRFAVKNNVIIHGGAGKLVKAFIAEVNPKSIVSYIDFNHTTSDSTFLDKIGFVEQKETGPRLVFHRPKDNKIVPMTSLLSIGADRILGTSYGSKKESGMNNRDIMLAEGFFEVYTAGNRVYLWNKEI